MKAAGGKAEGVHRHGTGHVSLAGARYQLLSKHAHGHASGATVVLLERVPTLYGRGVNLVGLNPLLYGKPELGLQGQLLLIGLRHLGVVADFLHLGFQLSRVVVNLACVEDDFAHVNRHYCYARGLEQLLAVAACVEAEGACADLADARVGHLAHDAADCGELVDVFHQQVAVD